MMYYKTALAVVKAAKLFDTILQRNVFIQSCLRDIAWLHFIGYIFTDFELHKTFTALSMQAMHSGDIILI